MDQFQVTQMPLSSYEIQFPVTSKRSFGSSVTTVMDDRGSILGRGDERTSFFATACIQVLGPTQTAIQWKSGAFSPGVKQQGCGADQ